MAPGLEGVLILMPPFLAPLRLVIGIVYGLVPESNAAADGTPTPESQKAARKLHHIFIRCVKHLLVIARKRTHVKPVIVSIFLCAVCAIPKLLLGMNE